MAGCGQIRQQTGQLHRPVDVRGKRIVPTPRRRFDQAAVHQVLEGLARRGTGDLPGVGYRQRSSSKVGRHNGSVCRRG